MARQRRQTALLWVGYGSFLSVYCCGPLSSLYLTETLGLWHAVLLAQLAYMGGTAAGCLALRSLARRQGLVPTPLQGAVGYGSVVLLCLVASALFAQPPIGVGAAALLMFVMGAATAFPLLFWYEALLGVCRTQNRARCILYIAASQLVPVVVTVIASLIPPTVLAVGLAGMGLAVVVAVGCQLLYARRTKVGVEPVGHGRQYRLTPFSTALLACLGVAWGLDCSVSIHTMEAGLTQLPAWVLPLTGLVACAAVAAMAAARDEVGIRFGGLTRLAVVAAGVVLAFVPVLHAVAPVLFYPLCEALVIFIEVAVVLFSIEVCYERGLAMAVVMPVNYGLFAGSACAGAVVFWLLQTFVGGSLAWELVAALATVAVVAIIPFLPSRTSDAVAFTLDELPENETYEGRAAQKRENLALKYGLTEREQEVLEPLMRGLTRQQIAEELGLSPWTIKDRVASIYEKVGVHSYKELMRAVE